MPYSNVYNIENMHVIIICLKKNAKEQNVTILMPYSLTLDNKLSIKFYLKIMHSNLFGLISFKKFCLIKT